jgi:hypothetical protein
MAHVFFIVDDQNGFSGHDFSSPAVLLVLFVCFVVKSKGISYHEEHEEHEQKNTNNRTDFATLCAFSFHIQP